MSMPNSIQCYYKSPEMITRISEQFSDYCEKNKSFVVTLSDEILETTKDKDAVILVSGISGSTKTFFSELFCLVNTNYTPIHLDCFAIPSEKREKPSNFLPENFDFKSTFDNLDSLLNGNDTNFPIYCHEDRTLNDNLIVSSKSLVIEGIHSHNPKLAEYFQKRKINIIKIALSVSFNYLQHFIRTDKPSDDLINQRIREYTSWVLPYSEDSHFKLQVDLNHVISKYMS